MSVHHHDELVEGPGQLGGQFWFLLEWLLPGEVKHVLLGDVIVDDCHTVVVTNKGSHSYRGER